MFPKSTNFTLALIILWVFVQCALFLHFGVKTSVDSSMYINDAQALLNGHLPEGRNSWYLGYSFFLAMIFFLGGKLTTVVFIQCACSGLAALALYNLVHTLSLNRSTALLSVIFYLSWIKIHQWNMFIYTDSLFASLSIVAVAVLFRSKKSLHLLVALLLILFTFFIRPTGIGFAVAIAGYFLFTAYTKLPKIGFAFLLLGVALVSALLLNFILKEFVQSIIASYAKAEIIYPDISLGIQKPTNLTIPSLDHSPIIQLLLFAWYNPMYFLKITSFKALLFMANVKPYFSIVHNLLIVSILYPIYIFAVYGFAKLSWTKEKFFILCFIVAEVMIVGLTSENWDGRFLIPVLPFVFGLAAIGISHWSPLTNFTKLKTD